jgi:hypothetical protein
MRAFQQEDEVLFVYSPIGEIEGKKSDRPIVLGNKDKGRFTPVN